METYYYITWVHNGTSGDILYINGNSAATGSSSTGDYTESGTLYVGSLYNVNYHKGIIDELGIWSRALTSAEVLGLYNSGSGIQFPFLFNIDEIILTSTNPTQNVTTTQGNTNDGTPTFNIKTDNIAICDINGTQCSTTNSTSHVCTQPTELNEGLSLVYISCSDSYSIETNNVSIYYDKTNPAITTNPDTNITIYTLSQDITTVCSDSSGIKNVSIYIDDTLYNYNNSYTNNTNWTTSLGFGAYKPYKIEVKCYDNIPNYNENSSLFYITTEIYVPPANGSGCDCVDIWNMTINGSFIEGSTGYMLQYLYNEEETNMLSIILSSIFYTIFLGVIFFYNIKSLEGNPLKIKYWIVFLSGFLMFLQMIFILGIIFIDASNGNVTNLLKINFYVSGLLGFGIGFISLFLVLLEIFNIYGHTKQKNKEKW